MAAPDVRDGLVVAFITGIAHWIWQLFGIPCITPRIRAWVKRKRGVGREL